MKRLVIGAVVITLVLALFLGACSPKPTPAPSPAPVTSQAPQATQPPAIQPAASPVPQTTQPAVSASDWASVAQAARKEGKALGYIAAGLTGTVGATVEKAFEQKYPGVTVEFVSGDPAALGARFRSEQAAKKYDVDFELQSQTLLWGQKGDDLLQPWGNLPTLKEDVWVGVPPKYEPEGYVLLLGRAYTVSYVNTDLVKPGEEPKSYLDLLKPEWKGKMIAVSPVQVQLPIIYSALKYYKALDADDYFTKLGKQDMTITASMSEPGTQLAQGAFKLAFFPHENFIGPLLRKGAPIKPIYFNEGVPLRNRNAFSMAKTSPHPNATRLFMNWLFSAEGQTIFLQADGGSPNRKDVPDFSPVSKIIDPQAKITFAPNVDLDKEVSRVISQEVVQGLMGLAK